MCGPTAWACRAGSGTYKTGAQIYGEQCASCHGDKLEGIRDPNLPQGGGPALIGGRGTLNTPKFKITVESYWPYATTLYDYILRAMPYTAPGSLEAGRSLFAGGLYPGRGQYHRQEDGDGRQVAAQGADAQSGRLLSRTTGLTPSRHMISPATWRANLSVRPRPARSGREASA